MKRQTVWAIVFLVGAYVICQAIADIGATKMAMIGSVTIPAGTFIFAATFTLRDMLHKRLGKEWARAAIVGCGVFNVIQAAYLYFVASLPYPSFFVNGEAWSKIFAIVPAITIASILAEVCSELVDTEVFHYWRHKFNKFPQWTGVLVSNAVSLPLDSFIFGTLAFTILPPIFGGQTSPIGIALGLVAGQITWKALVTVISLPFIYLVKERPLLDI